MTDAFADELEDLALSGWRFWSEGGRLRFRAPQEAAGDAVLARLRERKGEVLRLVESHGGLLELCPLSYGQRALFFLWKLAPESDAYNQSLVVRLPADADPATWRSASEQLIERHPQLRSTFSWRHAEPIQKVRPAAGADWRETDATGWSEERFRAELRGAHRQPFDLERGPVLRARCFRRPEGVWLVLTLHHIACDAWSQAILLRELHAAAKGEKAPEPLPISYHEVVRRQRALLSGEEGERLWRYWQTQLAGPLPLLQLPTDRPRPAIQSFRGEALAVRYPPELAARLQSLARGQGSTLSSLMLAAFGLLLARASGQSEVLVGVPHHGRVRGDENRVVGYFVDPVVIRLRPTAGQSFLDYLSSVHQTVLGAMAHNQFPFALLVERLAPRRDPSRSPFFDVLFNHLSHTSGRRDALELEEIPQAEGQFDLTLTVTEDGPELSAVLCYSSDLFRRATVARWLDQLGELLEQAAGDPEAAPIPAAAPAAAGAMGSAVGEPLPAGELRALPCAFARQAAATPDAVALIAGGQPVRYGELAARAGRLARRLRALGVGPEVRVGVCCERTPALLVALLGVLQAGGAYVPLIPDHPEARLRLVLEDSGATLVLTEEPLRDRLGDHGLPTLRLDGADALEREDAGPIAEEDLEIDPAALAYVLYTSGSTGRPKGVQVPHGAVATLLAAMTRRPGLGADDVLVAVTNYGFDISVVELFLPLLVGARLVLASEAETRDGALLKALLESSEATVLQATPASWQMLADSGWQSRPGFRMFTAGEALPRALAERLLAGGGELWNLYGPTETTIYSSMDQVAPGEGPVPIGGPVAGTSLHVLRDGRPAPAREMGDLWIGGAGVARGYHGRPGLTADRFRPDPFAAAPGGRLYGTGDLVRPRGDGRYEFLGRRDHQVKVRGHRIELGEVEAALGSHPAVRGGAVVLRDQRLVAYVVGAASAEELRRHLRARLPEPMVPSFFVAMDALPLGPSGKIDRLALPAVALRPELEAGWEAPASELERKLAAIFSELLGVERPGRHDDFFDLGGHSLLAVHLCARIEAALGIRLPVVQVLQARTVAGLARALETPRPSRQPSAEVLVPLRSTGTRPPVVLLPGAGGNVLYLEPLARRLGPEQPAWGLQALGLVDQGPIPETIEEIAARYLELLARERRLDGPLAAAGHSFGGLVAFEMARQLQARGAPVAWVGIFDNVAPGAMPGALFERWDDFQWLRHIGLRVEKLFGVDLALGSPGLAERPAAEQVDHVVGRMIAGRLLPPGTESRHFARFMAVYRANVRAASHFAPEPLTAPARVTLFRAVDDDPDLAGQLRNEMEIDERTLGWQRWSERPVEVVAVAGTHLTMMTEPDVGALAHSLLASLDAAGWR